jgi:hypothetical protein
LLRNRNSDRAKKRLAPINHLKQYALSNYHYEKIYLHPGQCRAPRGVRAKDRNHRARGKPKRHHSIGIDKSGSDLGVNYDHYLTNGRHIPGCFANALTAAEPITKIDLEV